MSNLNHVTKLLARGTQPIVKTAVAATMVGTLATPALADPIVSPPPEQYIPPVFCFRIMDINVTGEDRFRFEFEVLNWTDTEADDLAIAIAAASDVTFVDESGGIRQPSALPFPDGGGNQVIPNDWTVDPTENGTTAIHWDGGTPIPNIDLIQIAEDTQNVNLAQAQNDAIAAINAAGFPNNDFDPNDPETIDNGLNVLGGFIFEADDFQVGEVLSFNWFLTNEGVPIGTAANTETDNPFGFGNMTIARADLDGNLPDPLFPELGNTGIVQDNRIFAPDHS